MEKIVINFLINWVYLCNNCNLPNKKFAHAQIGILYIFYDSEEACGNFFINQISNFA